MTNTRPFFWQREADLETFQKLSSRIGVLYKLVLGSVKILNWIFRVTEYWYKAQKCKTCINEHKTTFLVKLRVFQKKIVLKFLKTLNRMFWVIKNLCKAKKYQIWSTNTKSFFWKSEANLQTFQQRSPYIGFSYKFILKSAKSLNRIFWAMECWFKAL